MEDSYERREILKVDGKASKKRTSDSSNVKPSDSKRAKKNTGEKHNDLVSKERHSRTSKENYLDSKTHRKPLQEAKVTSSKKLTGHTKKEAASVKGDTEAEISDVGMDSPPSSCENSHDVNNNNNMPSEHEEMSGREHGSSVDMDMSSDSERSVKMKHRQALDIPEGGGKHRLRVKDGDPNNDKWQETLDQTGSMKMTENRSETKKKNVKDEEAKRERKKAQNENAGKPIKEEEEEVPLQKDDQLKEKSKTKDKKIKKESKSSESKASKKDPTNATGKNKKTKTDTEGKQSKKRKKDEADDGKPGRKRGKTENAGDEDDKWKWWEEGQSHDGKKWKSLEHKGPLFPPEYDPLPENVSFYYNGKPVQLSLAAEEVATFYAKMLDHEYTTKEVFQKNFFADWRQEMTNEERDLIRSLSKCDFQEIHQYFLEQAEKKKAMTKEEKQVLKEEAQKLTEEYGYCILDGHREKIGNFRVEPPGLFRGRGEHPKMGKLKKRVLPEDITINCSEDGKIPEAPKGHKWKKVQHDNTVTWLASWVENVQGTIKYIMLNPSSKLKGEKDWQKYEIARKLKLTVDDIRKEYQANWRAREMRTRQMGVAVYFIDKLALRAGNEKEEGETADTVGCCSLRVEHITLHEQLDGQEWVVEFDFLGKDSIRYYNKVPVEKQVFKNLKLFMENKNPDDDLFDRINTVYLNKELNNFMKGLTAKVFRTYNASTTLQEQLNKLTSSEMSVEEKILAYNRANRAVAILCNHQRAAPKTFEKSMQNLQEKIELKEKQLEEAKEELQEAKKQYRQNKTEKLKKLVEQKEKAVTRLEEQLKKLKLQMTDREENKVIALGTSKLNYLDPRITVAWCKKFGVPVEKIYNKTQRDKFAWAIDMTDEDFQF